MAPQPIQLFLAYWVLACAIASTVILVFSIRKHLTKKTPITRVLLFAFAFFALGLYAETIGMFITLSEIPEESFFPAEDPLWGWNLFYHLLRSYQIAYMFVVIGVFFFYQFSQLVFRDEEKQGKTGTVMALIVTVAIVVYAIFRPYLLDLYPDIGELGTYFYGIDLYVLIFVMAVMIPILVGAIKLLKKIGKNDSHFTNLLFLAIMAAGFIGVMTSLVIETFVPYNPNFFSFLGWGLTLFTFVASYKGFFAEIKN